MVEGTRQCQWIFSLESLLSYMCKITRQLYPIRSTLRMRGFGSIVPENNGLYHYQRGLQMSPAIA